MLIYTDTFDLTHHSSTQAIPNVLSYFKQVARLYKHIIPHLISSVKTKIHWTVSTECTIIFMLMKIQKIIIRTIVSWKLSAVTCYLPILYD